MAGNVVNIKFCNPLKLRSGFAGNDHAICHYSYNLSSNCLQTTFYKRIIWEADFKKNEILKSQGLNFTFLERLLLKV